MDFKGPHDAAGACNFLLSLIYWKLHYWQVKACQHHRIAGLVDYPSSTSDRRLIMGVIMRLKRTLILVAVFVALVGERQIPRACMRPMVLLLPRA